MKHGLRLAAAPNGAGIRRLALFGKRFPTLSDVENDAMLGSMPHGRAASLQYTRLRVMETQGQKAMITDIEDYFALDCGRCDRHPTPDCSTRRWTGGLIALRRICLDVGLSEHVKWAHPCYMHAGRNIALIGAFRDDFRFTFMNPTLLKDSEGVLKKTAPTPVPPGCCGSRTTRARQRLS